MGTGGEVNQVLGKPGDLWGGKEELCGPLTCLGPSLAHKRLRHDMMV